MPVIVPLLVGLSVYITYLKQTVPLSYRIAKKRPSCPSDFAVAWEFMSYDTPQTLRLLTPLVTRIHKICCLKNGFMSPSLALILLYCIVQCVKTVVAGRALMPSVYRLQQLIERAWSAGYDEAGCRQLSGKLVGTRKWIGATEIYALLSFLGVR